MSKHPFFLRWMSLPLATVLGVALTMTAQTQVLGGEAARLDGFTQADGGNVFALTLKPSVPAAANGPRDVVILVSTAASQTGDYRAKSLATLQSALAKLDPNDRVKLVAFDLNATPLTQGLRGPQQSGDGRGARRAQSAHPAGLLRPGEGPGHGRQELRGRQQVGAGHRLYRRRQQPRQRAHDRSTRPRGQRSGCPAGAGHRLWRRSPNPRTDARDPGLPHRAAWSCPRHADVDADVYGAGLAQAVHGSVLWPKAAGNVKWPEGMDVYPKTLPPLRSDRDTVRGRHDEVDRRQASGNRRGRSRRRGEAGLGHSRVEVRRQQRLPGHPGRSGEGRRRPDAAFDR